MGHNNCGISLIRLKPLVTKVSGSTRHDCVWLLDGFVASTVGELRVFDIPEACQPNPCKNRATCSVDSSNSYQCKCRNGYSGKNCERGRSTLAWLVAHGKCLLKGSSGWAVARRLEGRSADHEDRGWSPSPAVSKLEQFCSRLFA